MVGCKMDVCRKWPSRHFWCGVLLFKQRNKQNQIAGGPLITHLDNSDHLCVLDKTDAAVLQFFGI